METIILTHFVFDGGTHSLSGSSVDLGVLSSLVGLQRDIKRFPLAPSYPRLYSAGHGTSVRILPSTLFIHPNYVLGEWGNNGKLGQWTYRIYLKVCLCQQSTFFFSNFMSSTTLVGWDICLIIGNTLVFSHCHRCLRGKAYSNLFTHIVIIYLLLSLKNCQLASDIPESYVDWC